MKIYLLTNGEDKNALQDPTFMRKKSDWKDYLYWTSKDQAESCMKYLVANSANAGKLNLVVKDLLEKE